MGVRRSTLKLSDAARRGIHVDPFSLTPLRDHVLVEVLEETWTRPSGLIIPENVRPLSCQGIVKALGPDVPTLDEHDLAPGDRVLFGSYQEDSWVWNDKEYVVMPYQQILAEVLLG